MSQINPIKLNHDIELLKEQYGYDRTALLPVLQGLQEQYRWLPPQILQQVAKAFNLHPTDVQGVASFYAFLETEKPLGKYIIRMCKTISCDLAGKDRIARQFENELGIQFNETSSDKMFTLQYTNCLGMCDQGPAVMVNDRLYARVTADQVPLIIEDCRNGFQNSPFPKMVSSSIMKKDQLLDHQIKPFEALDAALKHAPAEIISMVRESGLRGRGGAGFPTGLKWQLAANQPDNEKFVICNADEGEPGTFKDRYLLDEQLNLMIEGMIIAAYAIGAPTGIIYLRQEYLYLKDHIEEYLNTSLKKLKDNALWSKKLGENFTMILRMGAGAYICGEETALIESLEGKRGEPRNRPPYPVTEGFRDKPTVVNNVETFVAAAQIMVYGARWFHEHGTGDSRGTKLFSISGDCKKPGIYELPFGITINDLLKTVEAHNTKAVQIGGAAGLTVHKEQFDRTLAFEDIPSGGSVIIFSEERDMLQIAENFMDFFTEESCGQCTPCREGNEKLLEGIRLLQKGKCSVSYLNELVGLSETIKLSSRCGLGQTSPTPFVSIVKGFRNEVLGRVPDEDNSAEHHNRTHKASR